MFSQSFDYHRARSLADAHQLMAANPGARWIAGGHTLIPLMRLRLAAPSTVVDIGRVPELRGLTRQQNRLRIGALTTHAEIAASSDVRAAAPALADAAAAVGDPAVRNRGTIGGNVAHADPASDLPAVLVALDARITAAGPKGERTIPAEEFFTGIMTTMLAEAEIVTAVEVPVAANGHGSAYEKFRHPASGYAVVGVAAAVTVKDGACQSARVAVGGLVPHARRTPSVEKALAGKKAGDEDIAAAAARAQADLGDDVMGDLYASAEYRAAMAPVYIRRALAAAFAAAR